MKKSTIILATVAQFWLPLYSVQSPSVVAGQTKRTESLNRRANLTQAQLMLNLLRSSAGGHVDPRMIDSVLNADATALIISQQNISRTVTREQYKALLLALSGDQPPDIKPVDGSERSRRGVEGLRKDVWPSLRWAKTNTNLLAERVEEISRLDLYLESRALASRFLPERTKLSPRLYVVMGGRAGAAALEGDEIYFDVLITSYRAANGALRYPDPSQINEFFAHETHHIGLSQILNRTRSHLRMSNQEQRAFDFLTALIMEGSASYLINGHRSLEVMSHDPQFIDGLKKGNELIKLSGEILRSVLENNLNGEAYETATNPFLGSGWHSVGATMLAAIDQASGLRAVMKVLRDPRKLLSAYNQAVVKLKTQQERFDTGLALRVSSIGESR